MYILRRLRNKKHAYRFDRRVINTYVLFLCGVEFTFRLFATRAFPVFWQIFKRYSAVFRGVVNVTANRANIFTRRLFLSKLDCREYRFYGVI